MNDEQGISDVEYRRELRGNSANKNIKAPRGVFIYLYGW